MVEYVVESEQPCAGKDRLHDEWYTPRQYVDAARKVMGAIDLDPASCQEANRTVGATRFYGLEENGLDQEWFGRVWLNPPYSRQLIGRFSEKLVCHYLNGGVSQAVVLVNSSTDTERWWRLHCSATLVCFVKGRIRFQHQSLRSDNGPNRGQAFFYFGDKYLRILQLFRTVWRDLRIKILSA